MICLRLSLSLAALLAAGSASAQEAAAVTPVVVWMDRDAPDEASIAKAERLAGGVAQHYDTSDLIFPPEPWSKKDSDKLIAVSKAQKAADARKEEFEVERSMALALQTAINDVTVIRDVADRDALILALLWQASAIQLAFSEAELKESPEAAAFRVQLPGLITNKAFVDLYALDTTRRYSRGEVPDAATHRALTAQTKALASVPPATLEVGVLPAQATLVVNGVPQEQGIERVSLPPGHSFYHVLIDGVICGRGELDLSPGATVSLPRAISEQERLDAELKVEDSQTLGLPKAVETAVALVVSQHAMQPVYLAARTGDGRVIVVPYSGGARVEKRQPVTFAFGVELGGGAIASPSFHYTTEGSDQGELIIAPGGSGAVDLELGVYNLAIVAGSEVNITPTHSLLYGTGAEGATSADNLSTSVYAKVYGGLGVYALRPTHEKRPTLLLAANYGWFSPGHMGGGGRLTFGIPIDKRNWFKLTVHGFYGLPMAGYPEDEPLISGGLRLGFQTAL
jgi:hypothetical protein